MTICCKYETNNVKNWIGYWRIDNEKSYWNNTLIFLIKYKKDTLCQRKKEDAQIWKIKVNKNNTRQCIFIVLKKNGRMKIYKGQMNENYDCIKWTHYNSDKVADKWRKCSQKKE